MHPNAYELSDLPAGVPSVQNVQFLRLFHPTPRKFKTRPNAGTKVGPVKYHDHVEWEVEDVVDHKMVNGSLRYLIKWCDHLKPSWSRVEQLKNCAETLREYQQRHSLPLDFWDESSSSPESESGEDSGEESDEGIFLLTGIQHRTPEGGHSQPPSQKARDTTPHQGTMNPKNLTRMTRLLSTKDKHLRFVGRIKINTLAASQPMS